MNKVINSLCLSLLLLGATALGMDNPQKLLDNELLDAAKKGGLARANELLDEGAFIDARDEGQLTPLRTPLMWAVLRENLAMCELLIKRGASVDLKEFFGWTPLMLAAQLGNIPLCRLLIAAGASLDAKDKENRTPLMWAVLRNHDDVCKLLINQMIKPTKKQLDPIVKLLGIKKYKRSEQLNLQDINVVKQLIGKEIYNQVIQHNKPRARAAIMEIKYNDEKRQELLDYLDRL